MAEEDGKDLEKFYDEHVAPVLLALCKDCEEKGLSFAALVEWAPLDGGRGTTSSIADDASVVFRSAEFMARPGASLDALAMAMGKYARQHNLDHSSFVLDQMGIAPSHKDREENKPKEGEEATS